MINSRWIISFSNSVVALRYSRSTPATTPKVNES
jgi:hypothetical protein